MDSSGNLALQGRILYVTLPAPLPVLKCITELPDYFHAVPFSRK